MAWHEIAVTRSDEGFATLALNRPDKRNTLSIAMRREIGAAVDELAADATVQVLVLTATGPVFSAGLDVDEWAAPGVVAAGAYEHDPVAALARFGGPVIGAIQGAAVTGGLELALACDLLIASTGARFADTHARVGLLPGWGGSARLVRRIGLPRAKELALTARFLGAQESLDWGLVNRVVPPGQLQAEAQDLARQMAAAAPGALLAYKRLLDEVACAPLAEALRLERAASLANNLPADAVELAARIGRRSGPR